jgi:hypothetical protein
MRRVRRHKATWLTEVPHADAMLRESAARVTARDRRLWGYLLARLRAAAGQSLAEQAAVLDVSESVLTFLAICRLPRPGHRDEDIAAIATLVGINTQVLRGLLVDTANIS